MFLYAICNGEIGPGTTVTEASSGSTAVSEAYFARMLGLPFVAVMARTTSLEKVALIEREGGTCHLVDDPAAVYDTARAIANATSGHYLDQFTHAERATDWRGNNNIAESIFEQMGHERHPVPTWVVVGAGTGGTSATIGRFVRYRALSTQVAVVDPENSAFLMAFQERSTEGARGSRIEGIGRPRVEPSFLPHRRGPDDRDPRRGVDRGDAVPPGPDRDPGRRVDRHEPVRVAADRVRDAGRRGAREHRHAACATRASGTSGPTPTTAGWPSQGLELEPYLEVLDRAWTTGEWTG